MKSNGSPSRTLRGKLPAINTEEQISTKSEGKKENSYKILRMGTKLKVLLKQMMFH